MSAAGSGCPHGRSAVIRMMAAVAFAAAMLMPHAVQAEDVAAGTPNATQTANINSALDRLRQDIADATRVNAGVRPGKEREQNAREIAVYQRVLDNLTNKLANNELHPIANLARGKIDGTKNHVRFVFENDKAGIQGSSSPTGAYCPDNAYVLIGTKKNLKAYTDIKAATPAEARDKRTAFVNAGKVRRIRCPRGHMIFDSALLDPLNGVRIDPTTNDGWCKARELLDVLAHEKFHEIVIEDAIAALRKRKDFREGAASERTRRERAVFWNGASHGNHKLVYNWQIKVNKLALALVKLRKKEISRGRGAPPAAGERDALKFREKWLKTRIGELKGYKRSATGGTGFHSAAVHQHDECVGTTYHVSETVIEEGETLVSVGDGVAVEQETAGEADDGGIPDCPKAPGPAITYMATSPDDTPAEDEPTPVADGTPTTVTDDDEQPPATPSEDEPQTPEDDLDLGLVKATTSVVTVALSRTGSGDPVAGATVKLLDETPALPDPTVVDMRLTSTDAYRDDAPASVTGADGTLEIEVAPEIEVSLVEDEEAETPQGSAVLDVGDQDADADGTISMRHEIPVGEPMAQTVTAVEANTAQAVTPGGRLLYPAALAAEGLKKICVKRAFSIGALSLYVVSMPETVVDKFKEIVSQTEGVYFVEDDPCRQKERFPFHVENTDEFLKQTFSDGWSVSDADTD